jgi:tetratricopeptide (TPR) repeat protein
MPALSSGRKQKRSFARKSKLQPGNAEAATDWERHCWNRAKRTRRERNLARADKLLPDMPETLYSLGKAASLEGDAAAAEKEWTRLLTIEKESALAAQAHFGLAGLYRKQGKTSAAQHEMQEFQRLQSASNPPPAPAATDSQH